MSTLRRGLLPSISGKTDKFKELLDLHYIDHLPFSEISQKTGVPAATLQIWIRTFEHENPELSELMKKRGKEITPDDYKSLQSEISRLKKELAEERLRADFYEEMVAFGKEFYGIDLKKAGTK
ncbi:MAG: hypothetical protein II221_03570 [Paludibacteraceae bacterium]|nr:hypothetical protein [Paludibacteraceae bacterium]